MLKSSVLKQTSLRVRPCSHLLVPRLLDAAPKHRHLIMYLEQYLCCSVAKRAIRQGSRRSIYTLHYLQACSIDGATEPPHCPSSALGHGALRLGRGSNNRVQTTCAILTSDQPFGRPCLLWLLRAADSVGTCTVHNTGSLRRVAQYFATSKRRVVNGGTFSRGTSAKDAGSISLAELASSRAYTYPAAC